MTAQFEQGTSDEIINLVLNELLFFIRSSMATDSYVTSSIRKVVYVGSLESKVSQAQNLDEDTSIIIAVVMSVIVIILVLLFMSVVKRRRKNKSVSDRCSALEYTATESTTMSDTELTWRKALIVDDTWRKALSIYDHNSKVVDPDQLEGVSHDVVSSIERTHESNGETERLKSIRDKSITCASLLSKERRKRKEVSDAQDLHTNNYEPESFHDESITGVTENEEKGRHEENDHSAARVHLPMDTEEEVVSVTSFGSEQSQLSTVEPK